MNLYKAEYRKVSGNRCLWGCIWLYPLIGVLVWVLFLLYLIFDQSFRDQYAASPFPWDASLMLGWLIPNEPSGILRLPLIGFMAAIFAGEYQYQTWKNIVPPNRRASLILIKLVAVMSYIFVAFAVLSIIMVVGFGLFSLVFGFDYPPDFTAHNIGEAFKDLLQRASLMMVLLTIYACFASLFAIWSRSINTTVVITIMFSFMESIGIHLPVSLGVNMFHADWIAYVYLITPTYNINNVLYHMDNNGSPLTMYDKDFTLATSIIMLISWVVALLGLTLFSFQRQDIQ